MGLPGALLTEGSGLNHFDRRAAAAIGAPSTLISVSSERDPFTELAINALSNRDNATLDESLALLRLSYAAGAL